MSRPHSAKGLTSVPDAAWETARTRRTYPPGLSLRRLMTVLTLAVGRLGTATVRPSTVARMAGLPGRVVVART